MRRVLAALILSIIGMQPVSAGAWLRDPGKGFLSTSITASQMDDMWDYQMSLYAEHGVSRFLTLGVDVHERQAQTGHALAFGRVPLLATEGGSRIALEIGVGAHHWLDQWDPMLKATLSFGRGIDTPFGSGWIAVDAAVERRMGDHTSLQKLDLTAGLSGFERFNPMLQIETAFQDDASTTWAVTPSVIWNAHKGVRFVVGIETRSSGSEAVGLKIGIWRDF